MPRLRAHYGLRENREVGAGVIRGAGVREGA